MLERQIQDQSITVACEELSAVVSVPHEHEDEDFGPKTPPSSAPADEFAHIDDTMASVDMNMVFCADWLNDSIAAWPGMINTPLVHGTEQLREPTPSPATSLADLELSDLAWADL